MAMMTRRTAIGSGLTLVSAACASGFSAYAAPLRDREFGRSPDVLLLDGTIELPRDLGGCIQIARPMPQVVEVRLDAAEQTELLRIFNKSSAIAGISSGATLFVLERIAWDHGYRLASRSQCDVRDGSWRQDFVAATCGLHRFSPNPVSTTRNYRPSRADGLVHIWAMHKAAPRHIRQRA